MNANTDSTIPRPAPSGDETTIRLPIATLAPDPMNPRKMSDEARVGLGVSLETFGDLNIVFNEDHQAACVRPHARGRAESRGRDRVRPRWRLGVHHPSQDRRALPRADGGVGSSAAEAGEPDREQRFYSW